MQTFAPMGLVIESQDQIGMSYARTYFNSIPATGADMNLFQNQPVTFDVDGFIVPVTAADEPIVGVFAGIEFVDSNTRTPVVTNKYVSGTQFYGLLDTVNRFYCKVLIYDVENTIYRIQCSGAFATPAAGSVPIPQSGEEFNLDVATETVTEPDGSIFPFVGNTDPISTIGSAFGISYACLDPTHVAPSGANVGQFILWGNVYQADNYYDDAFPLVLVKVNMSTKYPALVPPTI